MKITPGLRNLPTVSLCLIIALVTVIVACGGAEAPTVPPATTPPQVQGTTPAQAPPTEQASAPQATPTTRAPVARPVSDPTPAAAPTAVPTPVEQSGEPKIDRVRMANTPPSAESNRIWASSWAFLIQHDPYGETLLGNHEVTSEPIPQLAESWEMSNGFKTWSFKLQEGVPWHFDYGDFTAADVAHTHSLMIREDGGSNYKTLWEQGEPTIVNDHEVVFNFDPPMVDGLRFFSRLAGDFVIQSKAQWDAAGGDETAYDEMPAGTGSYQYGGRKPGESIWYERIEGNHWNGERPDFQELQWDWVPEQFTRLAQLLSKEIQGADLSREVQVDALERGYKNVSSNNENNQSFGFFGGTYLNTDNPYFQGELPWHDAKVREAMNRAIDRDAFVDAVYFGRATVVANPGYAPFTEGWNDRWVEEFDDKYGYDPERAKQLLAEAGYGPGDIEIDMYSTVIPGNPEIPQLIETISTMWQEIGIETSIQDFDLGTWVDQWNGHKMHNVFSIIRNTPIRTTQAALRTFFVSEPDGFIFGWEHDYTNERFKCLQNSVDPDEREQCAREAGDFIFDNYASVPMFQITFDMTIDPEFISDWQYPGVGSAHPTHVQNIRACPKGTERCD